MDVYIVLYLGITYLFTLVIGYLQVRAEIDSSDSSTCNIIAITAVCAQGIVTVVVLYGTGWFPLGAVFLSFTLLSHHTIIHWRSRFRGETCSCAPFQCKDISNHETWVVAGIVAAVVSWLRI